MVFLPEINIVRASGTIYIRSDGSVEGTDKIQRDGNIYTFTDNINDSIVVEKNNVVVDGAGYTLQGTENFLSKGIDLSNRSHITLKNMKIVYFHYGIYLEYSENNTVSGNNITNNSLGIQILDSHSNTFYHNNLDNINQVNVTTHFPSYVNFWNDNYPSGGNYWSDYEERYPNATEIDGTGIWDTPYVIDENNQDNYPIVPEFPTWTSMLLILIILTVATAFIKRRLLRTPIH